MFILGLVLCLGLSVAAAYIGVAAIIGSFLVGMALAAADEDHPRMHRQNKWSNGIPRAVFSRQHRYAAKARRLSLLIGHHSLFSRALFLVGAIWMAFHAATMLLLAWLIKAPLFFLAVGSQANVGGAASAPVVASAFHPALAQSVCCWPYLVMHSEPMVVG